MRLATFAERRYQERLRLIELAARPTTWMTVEAPVQCGPFTFFVPCDVQIAVDRRGEWHVLLAADVPTVRFLPISPIAG